MLIELKLDESNFGRIYRDSGNREQEEYLLNRELTDTLLTGYSAAARLVVIRRWHILEAEALEQKNQVAIPNYPEALRQLAHQLETNEKLNTKLQLDAPKVKVHPPINGHAHQGRV